jgi:hypothetical protein
MVNFKTRPLYPHGKNPQYLFYRRLDGQQMPAPNPESCGRE